MSIVRFLLLLLHTVVVILMLGTFANAYIPPKIFPWINFLSLLYPILFCIHIGLTILWIVMWRKRAFVFLFISILTLFPMQRWGNFSLTKEEKKSNLKIVSLNFHAGREGEDKLYDFLAQQNPDIFFIQEGLYLNKIHFKEYHKTNQDEYIHIYTKFPIISSGVIYANENDIGKAIYADIDYDGTPIRLINFYLEPFQLDVEEKQAQNINKGFITKFITIFKKHQNQVEAIKDAIQKSKNPVIVAGDANAVPNSYEYYQISEGLYDSFQESGMGIGTTFHETIIPIKIDYIFSSKNIKPVISKVFRERKLSDHTPIITELEVR